MEVTLKILDVCGFDHFDTWLYCVRIAIVSITLPANLKNSARCCTAGDPRYSTLAGFWVRTKSWLPAYFCSAGHHIKRVSRLESVNLQHGEFAYKIESKSQLFIIRRTKIDSEAQRLLRVPTRRRPGDNLRPESNSSRHPSRLFSHVIFRTCFPPPLSR